LASVNTTRNSTWTSLVSSTLDNYLSTKFTDQVYNGMPFYAHMVAKKRKVLEDGGNVLVEPLRFSENTTGDWLASGYDPVDTTPQDEHTSATFNWKEYANSITFSERERDINNGKNQIINLLSSKVDNAKMSFQKDFTTSLFSDGTASGGNELTGLGAIVAATGTFGGIDRGTYTWWQANVDSTTEPLTEDDMRDLFNDCWKNLPMGKPTLIITTQDLFQRYESMCLTTYRTTSLKMGDLGFETLTFKGVPIMWDNACNSGTMYFLNDNFIRLRVHRNADMTITESRYPTDQFAFTRLLRWFGNITVSNCRHQGKLSGKS
jgi:hypothetical protein